MQHPYAQLAPVYASWWAHLQVKPERQHEAMGVGARLLRDRATYEDLQAKTSVPALWTMCTNEREDSGRLDRYLGNGDPLNAKTRDVPRNRGPFFGPTAWVDGARDAFGIDGIDKVSGWSMPRATFEWILWNGWGYDAHGIRSPYAVGGTTLQQIGRYASDGHFVEEWDGQLGCLAVAWAILQQAPDLALPAADDPAQPIAPPADAHTPPPLTVGGSHHDAKWLQAALNEAFRREANVRLAVADLGGPDSIAEDGNVGRQTRLYVRAFEKAEGLAVDRGFAGPQVLGRLDALLGADWRPAQAA